METEWVLARIDLYRLMGEHPDWSIAQLAETLGYSPSWVKKWRRRFRAAERVTLALFQSQSRAPHHPRYHLSDTVVQAVLGLRDSLKAVYHRVVGPYPILYHLHRDPRLHTQGEYLPRSTHTVWQILKAGGRIPTCVREHVPLPRPAPLSAWEFDFGLTSLGRAHWLEFAVTVDAGTSILIDTQTAERYQAESALAAIARLFLLNGRPQPLRFDRDTRLVGSWSNDGYPSAFVRFLLCLDVEPVICPPRRPDRKPFVERCIRTLKYECLFEQRLATPTQAGEILTEYRTFYNTARANQALSCQNQPPQVAFPELPPLPPLPDQVDPDRWLQAYHGRFFRRRVAANGNVMVDKYRYFVGKSYAGQRVALRLDAHQQVMQVLHQGHLIKTLPLKGLLHEALPFQAYLQVMLAEARSIQRHLALKAKQRRL